MSPLRLRLLLLALLTSALLAAGAWQVRDVLELDASTATLLAGDKKSSHAYEKLGRLMGDRVPLGVLVRHEALFSNAGRDALFALSQDLEALPEVNDVKSLTHSRRPVRRPGFSLDPRDLIDNQPFLRTGSLSAEQWSETRKQVLGDPLAASVFVSEDGRYAMVLAVAWGAPSGQRLDLIADRVAAVTEVHRSQFAEMHLGGFPYLEREVSASVRRDARLMLGTAAAAVALILLLAFRSLWALVYLMLLGGAGLCGVPLAMALLGTGLDVYTALLLPLVAGLQLTFLAHQVSALRDGERTGAAPAAVLRSALLSVSWPSLLAASTTALGLCALQVSEVTQVRTFGAVGALSVALALVLSLVPAWALSLALGAGGMHAHAHSMLGQRSTRYVDWLGRRKPAVVLVALVLALASGFAASGLSTDLRAIGFLDEHSPSRVALTAIDEHMGGLNALQLKVDAGSPGGAQRREVLAFLLDLAAEAERQPGVSHAYHLGQVYARLEQLWRGGTGALSGAEALPQSDMQLALYGTLLKAVNVPLLDLLLDDESRVATLVVRARDMPAQSWLAILDHLMAFAREHQPDGVELSLQAGLHELLDADRRMVAAQRDSLAAAALAVFVLLALVLRSARLAGLTVVANLLPLLLVLGVMGAVGVSLDSVTVMVGALALGVAVDDAIHLLLWLRAAQGTARERMAQALGAKVLPMATTSAVMAAVFGLFAFSSFPPVRVFGALGALAMGAALLSTLVLLPALVLRRQP